MYGYTKNFTKNLDLLLDGVKKNIDVCFINDTPFVYVACLGDYIDMAYNTPRKLKKKYGKLAYIMYGLKQLRNKINSYDIRYTIDGKTYEGHYSFFFITNASRVAGVNDVYYDIKLDDNKFEVAFCHVKSKAEIMKKFILLNNMDAKDVPGIDYYQTDNLEIEFLDKPKVSWCIDGEEYMAKSNRFVFRVDHNTKMMLPRENVIKLFQKED
jgi:diacylglycerol kinase family enzyme